jgi:uncharacterized protein (TIGR00369 family)
MVKRLEIFQHLIKTGGFTAPVGNSLGLHITQADEDSGTIEVMTQPYFLNLNGVVQGGILSAIADAAMGIAFGSIIDDSIKFTSVEFKINLVHPILEGKIIAKGQVIYRDDQMGITECTLYDERDQILAKAMGTLIFIEPNQA